MNTFHHDGIHIHYREDGDPAGAPLVFSNSLGTDLRIWDDVLAELPPGLRVIRYDTRGHGLTTAPPAPYSMGTLVRDVEALLDHLGVKDACFVGLSIGGLIAQGLTVKRPDLVAKLVLTCTAAKIGTHDMWQERIDGIRASGVEALADGVIARWFAASFCATPAARPWREMLARTHLEGYVGCCAAIQGTDMLTPTSGLRLPAMAIAGTEDQSTPPDLVRETANLIPGCRFELMRGVGHIPNVEKPAEYAGLLTDFLHSTGHI